MNELTKCFFHVVLQGIVKVYNLSNLEDVVCDGDITALAHNSPISLGTSHGVYILPDIDQSCQQPLVEASPCLEVLQKPSVDKMRARGAVMERNGGEMIYSDGSFWLGTRTVETLIDLYRVGATS